MSNRQKGDEFAARVGEYLSLQGHAVSAQYRLELGLSSRRKKVHCFDYGNDSLLVECKSYDWTEGGYNPSAKISTLNEAMMWFHAAPKSFQKMAFILATRKKGVRNPEVRKALRAAQRALQP